MMTPALSPVHYLLVDDLEENLLALEGLLRRPDLVLLRARSGTEALELLLKYDVALALIDVQMPVMDGFELAEKDAELRGPGDILGLRQSGAMPLRHADPVRDLAILQVARRMAQDLVDHGQFDQPEFAALKAVVLERFANLLDLPQTG